MHANARIHGHLPYAEPVTLSVHASLVQVPVLQVECK
jgi:hypothetical protein